MIKAVIFDIDGVLLDSREANRQFNRDLFDFLGLKHPKASLLKNNRHLPLREIIRLSNQINNLYKLEKMLERGRRKISYPTHLLKFYQGCQKAIKQLAKSYRLGVVTSRSRHGLNHYLEFAETKKCFKARVSLNDVTNHKPHPEPLLLAAKKLKIKPEQAVYVGDTPADMQAARAAGMKGIAYGSKKITGADLSISHFKQLIPAVKKLNHGKK